MAVGPAQASSAWSTPAARDALSTIDRTFEEYQLDAHVPGLVYGIVVDGRLAHVRALGVQELEARRPVTADTLFRIASMTKSFTALSILNLRDKGMLALDLPAETYVPELSGWRYPTEDSRKIRVRDLLNHVAGFVTDDPWGDRQTPLPEAEFTELLRAGVPFTRPPGTAYEYSNLGYATLGRIVTNVAGQPYAQYIDRTLLKPLGMSSSGFVADDAPRERRALGYRWEDDAWRLEPTLAHGAFGAMGGLQTSASDYSKYVAWLLAAWPARDGADSGPVKRSTVRELAEGSNFPLVRERFGQSGPNACRQAATYGMGMIVAADCDLGLTLSHGGGYPGYGSHVLLLPDHGVGIFALANRTYAGPYPPVWDAAVALHKAGLLEGRSLPVSEALAAAYRAAGAIYARGDVTAAGDVLAMNFVLDRSAEGWVRDLERLRRQVGECDASAPIKPTGRLSGEFSWRCAHGRVKGSLLLAPTVPPRLQELKIGPATP
ncbi:MAG TPA: serine hydrolase domain-containing protein [Vicinamibacteria bacterium]|nr:serine hydrolase domain-containing protein [Vicinamibacteria bacterium]